MSEKKYYTEYDSGIKAAALAEQIINDPDLPNLKSIIIGMWDEEIYDVNPDGIFAAIVANKDKFQHIESLFVGDMEQEENEVSWIHQGNYEELLKALPNLKTLKIKGSEGLSLGKVDHKCLEELVIITGGLPASVVNQIKAAQLPNLKKLVLYAGVEDYGGDCNPSDFAALAKKDMFPKLKYLGFVNSDKQDELVQIILDSDILPQLETVGISFGCLTDKGGQLILDGAPKLSELKKLRANFHYMSKDMVAKLKALPFEVEVDDPQNDEYMYPMITE